MGLARLNVLAQEFLVGQVISSQPTRINGSANSRAMSQSVREL